MVMYFGSNQHVIYTLVLLINIIIMINNNMTPGYIKIT